MPPKRSFAFRPPKNNRATTWVARHLISPLLMRPLTGIARIEVGEGDLKRLKDLTGRRVILTPNHSEENEPFILIHLSNLLGHDFNYLTAKEVFESYPGFAWFFQGLGAYSIVRGVPDLSSFRMTRKLLVEGKRWLVIFPEGVAVGLGDTVMPFQPGVVRLALSAQEELAKLDPSAPVLFVPLAIKYLYLKEMAGPMERALCRLEKKVGLEAGGPDRIQVRLARIGEAVINRNEQAHGLRLPGMGMNQRMSHLREVLTGRVAAALGISLSEDEPLIQRLRGLQNRIEEALERAQSGDNDCRTEKPDRKQLKELQRTVMQVRNFVALDTAYIEEKPTVERLFDVLGLLEVEVFGKRRFRGPRKAVVRVGKPVSLLDYRERFRKERDVVAAEIAARLEGSVRTMLEEMAASSRLLPW